MVPTSALVLRAQRSGEGGAEVGCDVIRSFDQDLTNRKLSRAMTSPPGRFRLTLLGPHRKMITSCMHLAASGITITTILRANDILHLLTASQHGVRSTNTENGLAENSSPGNFKMSVVSTSIMKRTATLENVEVWSLDP